jgi:hypothetical protein
MKQFVYCYNNTFLAAPMAYILQQNSIVDTEFGCKNLSEPDPYDLIGDDSTVDIVEPFVHEFIRIIESKKDRKSLSRLDALLSTKTFDVGVLGLSYGQWNIEEKWDREDIKLVSCQLADGKVEAKLFFDVYKKRRFKNWEHIKDAIRRHCRDHHYNDDEYRETLYKNNIDFAKKLYDNNELLYKWQLDTLFHSSYKEIFTLDRENEIREYDHKVIANNHLSNLFRKSQAQKHIPNMLTMDLEEVCDYLGWNTEEKMYNELKYFKKYVEDLIND